MKSPVGFGESLVVWKFIQRLPVDRPPDLRFRFQVREQTFTHQTHLRVWPRPTSELDLNKHSNVKHHMNIHQICSDLLLLEWTRWHEQKPTSGLLSNKNMMNQQTCRSVWFLLSPAVILCLWLFFVSLRSVCLFLPLCCCLSLSHDVVIMLHLLFLVLLKRIFFLSTNVHVEVLLMHLQSPAVSSSVDINQAAGCSCSNTHYMYMWRWFDGARTRR